MKITNKKKHGDVPVISGAMKEYKNNPGSLNAAAGAASWKAKQMKQDIVVVQGNSYGNRVYHLALTTDSLSKFTAMSSMKANVVVVTPKGIAYMATAEDEKKNESLIEKYLEKHEIL